jgi:hypothetical protein
VKIIKETIFVTLKDADVRKEKLKAASLMIISPAFPHPALLPY